MKNEFLKNYFNFEKRTNTKKKLNYRYFVTT